MFSLSEIRDLIDAFERSDWEEVHLVADGVEVHVSSNEVATGPAHGPAVAAGPAHAPAVAPAPAAARAPSAVRPAPPAPTPAANSTAPLADPGPAMEGAHAVVSPSPGIFWRAPAPGEPPFVEVGQAVSADTPIGIVELMKLMNQVLAGTAGTVRSILVENGARVERSQPMVLIDAGS